MFPERPLADSIAANANNVRERLATALARVGRDPNSVRIVAVSKKFPLSHVRAAAAAGLTDLGENRVQEALQKIEASPDLPIAWHLIGHLQSNKARRAASAFAWIHSIDNADLLQRLDHAAGEAGTAPILLVQINQGREAQKSGAAQSDVRAIFEAAARCEHVRVRGLMTLPPWTEDPEASRPFFRDLRQLRDDLVKTGVDPTMLEELSMGMSRDLEIAAEEGATIIRVGTALFGPRPRADDDAGLPDLSEHPVPPRP